MLRHLAPAPMAPARIVVIGGSGFVGGALCRRIARAQIPVLAINRQQIDLLADDADKQLRAILQPGDAVVAAAARAPCRSLDMLVENVKMTRAMVAALKDAAPSHVINISSDAVYADEPVPIDEETPTAPGTLHGVMHLAREIAFRSDISAPLTIVRPTLLYGLEDPHNGYGPNRFRRLAAAGENIAVFGAGEERRDHVWIDDLAEILFRILTRRSIGVLNVATGDVHSFRALAEAVAGAARRKVAVEETPRVGPMPHNGYRPFDIAATRAAFPDFAYAPAIETVAKLQSFAER
ncbi:NAD(P)-dependent oxidoreductase [Methylocystis sp. SC2]|uniref:NAD-dependent epimerase/dehydratase family protein n=1 Tax=Methylocystis sp. (strain SC2) TaxID=187303 RepID=UPI00027AECAB|nr:NAD-dependent epimerase/dehydratase family protein [Methylocystis sp. SC2]CCJ07535.1 NAD-dependent epimerase/dehydratase family protein [Methylocystis sp. SC2]